MHTGETIAIAKCTIRVIFSTIWLVCLYIAFAVGFVSSKNDSIKFVVSIKNLGHSSAVRIRSGRPLGQGANKYRKTEKENREYGSIDVYA